MHPPRLGKLAGTSGSTVFEMLGDPSPASCRSPMRPSDRSEWEISALVQVQFYKTIREGSLFIRLSTRLASREAYACDAPRPVQQTIALPLSGPQVSSGVASHPLLVWVSDQGLFPAAMFLINSLGMRFAEGTVQVQRAR